MPKLQKHLHKTLNQVANPELDPHVALAAAVLVGGYLDMDSKKETIRGKGRRFFQRRRFELWADMLHRDHAVVMAGFERVLKDGVPLGDKRRDRYRTQS